MATNPVELFNFLKPLYPFRNIPDNQIRSVVDSLKEIIVEKDEIIFAEGGESDRFFILFEGNVRLSRRVNEEEEETLGVLESGNYFGYEAWDGQIPRRVTATAISRVHLFYLTTDALTEISWRSPQLAVFFNIMWESYTLSLRMRLDWRNPDEAVLFFCRRHVVFLWLRLIIPLIGLIFSAVFLPILYFWGFPDLVFLLYIALAGGLLSLMAGVWAWVDWDNDDYIVTTQRVLSRQKILLIYDARQEAPLSAILSVTTSTTYWGRRFGYGEVNLRTYTGNIVFKGLPYYLELESLLKEKQNRAQIRYTKIEQNERIRTVKQRLGLVEMQNQPAVETKDAESQSGQQSFFGWLYDQFRLRREKGGVIIYRTHWLILLRQTWLPGLLFLLSLGLGIVSLIFPIPLISPYITGGLFLLLTIGMGLWWLYRFIDWHNDIYIITEDQIIDINRKPFGKEEKRSAPLNTIQSIQYERLGLIGLLFDFGTVSIRIGDDQFTFDFVSHPSAVQGEIFLRLARRKQIDKMTAMKNEGKLILDWIEAYHLALQENKKPDTQE